MDENQPWVTCFLTQILVSYMQSAFPDSRIDYSRLFQETEGFDPPSHPESFLRDGNNWVPLPVLGELISQCERISGCKDIAYRAARSFFNPGEVRNPSLFAIIVRALNDVRSTLICCTVWGSVQTNYLKLQAFENQGPELYMLAQWREDVRPTIGAIYLLRGIGEGFPRLYPFVEDVRCEEQISQVRVEDIVREFPGYRVESSGDHLKIRRREEPAPVVEAVRTPLRSETVSVSPEFVTGAPDSMVAVPQDGSIEVLTGEEETDPRRLGRASHAYRIVVPGEILDGSLRHSFERNQIYDAPYSRFRFTYGATPQVRLPATGETVRRQVSDLLFEHLREVRETQKRMIQYNIEKRKLTLENLRLRREIEREYSFAGIVGASRKIQELFRLVRSIADTDLTVIVQGETGTGKELIAKAIHYASPRKGRRFVAVNCGALAETLLESELFGHEKGAFTGATSERKGIFEVADGGTLFLDEIGEISPSTQVKLLRVLEESEFQRVGSSNPIRVDVRVVAATNQDLSELVKQGSFRKDLYFRLNVFPVLLPPLRERAEDIPLLAAHFIEKCNRRMRRQVRGVSPSGMTLLASYGWPGNVRELENVIQRMMVVARGDLFDLDDLPPEIRGNESQPSESPANLKQMAQQSSGIVEKRAIAEALAATGGNVTRTAQALGVSRATLQNKMKRYGLRNSKI